MNVRFAVLITLAGALVAGAAQAHGPRYAKARVLRVEPVYEHVVVQRPITSCYEDVVERRVSRPRVGAQTLAGAIVGAAVGRQFGDGSGRDALTVIGAVAGSAVANERARRRQGSTVTVVREPVERCTTEYRRQTERRITGYWVDYRYRGRNFRILSHERPGREIRIAVRS
jgi:uncharacterized protein YcfJ